MPEDWLILAMLAVQPGDLDEAKDLTKKSRTALEELKSKPKQTPSKAALKILQREAEQLVE